jgi:anti-anti-sigma regulatory factor
VIAPLHSARRPAATERPMFQWEAASGLASATLRLYGSLGRRELALVVETIAERARSPRDVLSLDFENVLHLDFRALPEFAQRIARHRHRGASIWLVGLSPYVRSLFDVSGQGSVVRQLAWQPEERARRDGPNRPFARSGVNGAAGADRFPR